jgi:hypothetical protein
MSIWNIVEKLKRKKRTELTPPDLGELKALQQAFGRSLPADLIELFEITNSGFFEMDQYDCWRLLSPGEILSAKKELQVDFLRIKKIPVIDCKENNFICWDLEGQEYQFFNIVDQMSFGHAVDLAALFHERLSEGR